MESTMEDSKAVHDKNKIFVGGLSQDTDIESLRNYFENWGEIVDAVVMYDNNTRRSRGFGFVTFGHAEAVNNVMEKGPHTIDRKEVECKKACPRDSTTRPGGSGGAVGNPTARTDKIFVGGLPDLSTHEFREYFDRFGRVVDAVLMFDRNNNRPRGFGFVTFDTPDVVEKVIAMYREHYLKGKWVEVKRAQPKEMNAGRGTYDRNSMPRDYAVGPMGYGLGDGGAGSYGHGPEAMYQQQPMQGAYSQHMQGRMGGYGQPQVPGGGAPPGVHGAGAYDASGYGGYAAASRVQGPPSQHAYASGGYGVSAYGAQGQGVSDSLHFSPPNTQPLSQQVAQSYPHPSMYSGAQAQFQQHGSSQHMSGANGPHGGPMNGNNNMGGYGGSAQPQHPLNMGAPQGGMMARPTGYSPPHSREASGMGGGQGVGQLSHDSASGYNMLLGTSGYGANQGGGYGGMSPVGGHLDGLPQAGHATHQQPAMNLGGLTASGGGLGGAQPMGSVQNQYAYGLQDQSAGQGGMR